MNIKRLGVFLGLGFALQALTIPAQSSEIFALEFEDDDIEWILRPVVVGDTTTFTVLDSGKIVVGDIFFSVFEVPTVSADGEPLLQPGSDDELTGVAAIQLEEIVLAEGVVVDLVFGAYTGGLNDLIALGYTDPTDAPTVAEGGANEGATIAMWVNAAGERAGDDENTEDIDLVLGAADNGGVANCTSLGTCILQASLGVLFQVDGFTQDADGDRIDPDEHWDSSPDTTYLLAGNDPLDIDDIAGYGKALNVSTGTFRLATFFNVLGEVAYVEGSPAELCNGTGIPGADLNDGCFQFAGSSSIQGGQYIPEEADFPVDGPQPNGAIAHSDFQAVKFVVVSVPEPATLALFGAGLLGIGYRTRRKA